MTGGRRQMALTSCFVLAWGSRPSFCLTLTRITLPGSSARDPTLKTGFCPNEIGILRPEIVQCMDTREFLLQVPLPAIAKWKKIADWGKSSLRMPKYQARPARMISVIIPAHNEEAYLERTLETLSEQQ